MEDSRRGGITVVEFLPNNAKTAEILKKRAEEEEVRRLKMEELKL